MAVDVNATRRQRVFNALADGASRTFSRTVDGIPYSCTLSNPQIRTLNGDLVLSIDMSLTRDGVVIFEDRVNQPNPPLNTRANDGTVSENPLQALRTSLLDIARAATDNWTAPYLRKSADGTFKGDTLAVRSTTADGKIESDASTIWATVRNGNSLLANTSTNPNTVEASDIGPGTEYQIGQFFLDFDTSSLGSGATLSNAVFTLYGTGTAEVNTDSYDMQIRPSNWGGTLTTADYFDCAPQTNWTDATLMAHFAVASWNQTNNTANNFMVDSYADVSKTGVTYVVVGMSALGSTTAPTGVNTVTFYNADNAGTSSDPLLTVTYTVSRSITSVAATATSDANAPAPIIAPDSTAATVTSQGENPTPTLLIDSSVSTASSQAETPTITTSATSDVTITSVVSASSSDALSPVPTISVDSTEGTTISVAYEPTPVIAPDSQPGVVTSDANAPGTSIAQPAEVATAISGANAPVPVLAMDGIVVEVSASANAPTMDHTLEALVATVTVTANTPAPTLEMTSEVATSTATANAPTLLVVPGPAEVAIDIAGYRVSLHLPNVADAAVEIGKTYDLAITPIGPQDALALGLGNTYALEIRMSNETVYVGTQETVTATFTTVATGAVVDPSTVSFKARLKSSGVGVGGRTTAYLYGTDSEVIKDSTGVYHIGITPDAEGVWEVAAKGTGSAVVVNQDSFTAIPSIFD